MWMAGFPLFLICEEGGVEKQWRKETREKTDTRQTLGPPRLQVSLLVSYVSALQGAVTWHCQSF